MSSRVYKTLPSAFRRNNANASGNSGNQTPDAQIPKSGSANFHTASESSGSSSTTTSSGLGPAALNNRLAPRKTKSEASPNPAQSSSSPFQQLNSGITNLIHGGINFFGAFRSSDRKKSVKDRGGRLSPSASNEDDSSEGTFYEALEMSIFPSIPDPAGKGETGIGHKFYEVGASNPSWCDLCGDLIWGLFETGTLKCHHCAFTCHVKCQPRVRLNCSSLQTGKDSDSPLVSSAGATYHTAIEDIREEFDEIEEEDENIDFEDTLANISTLQTSESLTLDNNNRRKSSITKKDSESDDDEDAYKTLRDVDAISLEADNDLPRLEDEDGDETSLNLSDIENDLEEHSDTSTLDEKDDPRVSVSLPPDLAVNQSQSQYPQKGDTYTKEGTGGFTSSHNNHKGENTFSALLSTLPLDSEELFTGSGGELQLVVDRYNDYHNALANGQESTVYNEGKSVRGFVRVKLNLQRPINVISGTKPPSVYNLNDSSSASLGESQRKTLTAFYLPPDTEKSIHVTSDTTTKDVIRALLAKFKVADTPHKYALYERSNRPLPVVKLKAGKRMSGSSTLERRNSKTSLSRIKMRKVKDEERPLVLALYWSFQNLDKCLVLQENDPGEVSWESFSGPELKNFLLILDREEAWYKKRIHDKYETIRDVMESLIDEKRPPNEGEEEETNHQNRKFDKHKLGRKQSK